MCLYVVAIKSVALKGDYGLTDGGIERKKAPSMTYGRRYMHMAFFLCLSCGAWMSVEKQKSKAAKRTKCMIAAKEEGKKRERKPGEIA